MMTRVTIESGNNRNNDEAAGAAFLIFAVIGVVVVGFYVVAAPVIFAMHISARTAGFYLDLGQVIAFSVASLIGYFSLATWLFYLRSKDLVGALKSSTLWWGVTAVVLLAAYLFAQFALKLPVFDDLFHWLEFPFGARSAWGG